MSLVEGEQVALSLRDVGVRLKGDRRWLLKGINVDVKPGQMLSVMGPCGSGKTVRPATNHPLVQALSAGSKLIGLSFLGVLAAWRQGARAAVSPHIYIYIYIYINCWVISCV